MTDRQFKPDLTGSDETLEHLLDRLRSLSLRPPHRPGRDDWDHFVTNRPSASRSRRRRGSDPA